MIIKSDEHKSWFEKEYFRIKEQMSSSILRDLHESMSEDIFHDTILKVNNIKAWLEMKPDDYENYLYRALKNNILREKQYARVRKTQQLDITTCEPVNEKEIPKKEYWMGREEVVNWITKKYGSEYVDLFGAIIFEGKSILGLSKNYPGLRYKIKKILKWIANNYDEEILLDII